MLSLPPALEHLLGVGPKRRHSAVHPAIGECLCRIPFDVLGVGGQAGLEIPAMPSVIAGPDLLDRVRWQDADPRAARRTFVHLLQSRAYGRDGRPNTRCFFRCSYVKRLMALGLLWRSWAAGAGARRGGRGGV